MNQVRTHITQETCNKNNSIASFAFPYLIMFLLSEIFFVDS